MPGGGYFVPPTLFGPVPRSNALAREEIFGPVLAAMPFSDEADAIALANGTDYGLLAAVWTENGGRQQRVAKACMRGRCSSTATAPAAGSNFRSAAPSAAATAARRACWRSRS